MKAEEFDALSNEQKIKHLSDMASLASYEKYSHSKTKKKDKRSGENMPGRNADFVAPVMDGLFEEG